MSNDGSYLPKSPAAAVAFRASMLALGVGVDVRAVVIKEVALNVGLAGLVEEREFIGQKIWVVAIHVGIVSDVARARGSQDKRLVRSALSLGVRSAQNARRVSKRAQTSSCATAS